VRRLFGWTAGLVGIAALARLLARRQVRREAALPSQVPSATGEDPAEALRQKLSDTRAVGMAEPVATDERPAAEQATESIEERRARVHAKAQEAIEAMQEPPR
jgi:hypothetical protein